jgi:hypothetical protein
MTQTCHARPLRAAYSGDSRSRLPDVDEEVVRVAAHDQVALAEIDLYGELIIAAAATPFERLPADRIDEVLRVGRPDSDGSKQQYRPDDDGPVF